MSETTPRAAGTAFPARWAWILAGLAAVHRLATAWATAEPAAIWMGDARDYLEITQGLLRGVLGGAVWVWPPGYPAAGAALAWLGGAEGGLLAASAVFGAAAPLLLLGAARRSPAMRVAAPAAVILALFPELTLASGRPLSDSVGLALLVAAAAGAVAAARARRARWAVLGGIAGGIGILAVLPFAMAPFLTRPRAAAARRAALYLLPVLLIVTPYVIGLREASGVWALSLKPQYNLTKIAIYREPIPYLEKRARWAKVHEEFRPDGGEWRPEAIARAADPRAYLTSPGLPRQWLVNLVGGFGRASPEMWGLTVLGVIGLCLPAGAAGLERWIAVAALLPFLPGPAFYSPFGRYLLPLVPGLAWGAGLLLDFVLRRTAARPAARRGVAAAFCVAALAPAVAVTPQSVRAGRFETGRVELEFLVMEGKAAEAKQIVDELLRREPGNYRYLTALAEVLESDGDAAGADAALERALAAGAPETTRAALHVKRGQIARADSLLRGIRPRFEESLDYWDLVGEVAFRASRWADAIAAFDRSEAAGGDRPKLAYNRAMCLARLGRLDDALAQLRVAEGSREPVVRKQAMELRTAIERSR
jgi:hypothetical protein